MNTILNIDSQIFLFVNKYLHNVFLDKSMPYLTQIGSGEFIVIIGILLCFFKDKKIRLTGILLLAGATLSFYLSGILKELFARPRPFIALNGIIPLVKVKSHSFPSGHSMNAFMFVYLMSHKFKKYALFYLVALFVAFTRIYVGVHYPLDATAGAVIGVFLGFILTKISE